MPTKNKQTKRKKSAKKTTPERKTRKIARASNRTKAKRNPRRITAASKRSLLRQKKFSAKKRRVTSTGLVVEAVPLPSWERPHLGGLAGDLQSLSDCPTVNSESVNELLEEGSALEAEAIQGVENALNADQGDVQTHEVPEDDVPQQESVISDVQ
jgi:hypothetical protein